MSLSNAAHASTLAADVAIIGAGPVGLTIANLLGQQGVSVIVIEKLERIIDYPRAIGLDDEALRVFQSIGLASTLLPHITPDHWMRFTTGDGHCFASIEPRTDEFGWSRRNAFLQPLADQVLYDGLKRFPHVQVLFGHSIVSFTQNDQGVTIEAEDSNGAKRTIRAAYMVGADGGASSVRRGLDLPFEGRTKPNQWIVVDVRNDPVGTPHIYLVCDNERPYVSAALPHGIRRFEFMVMPDETEEELSKPENLAKLMSKVVAQPDKVDYIRKRVYTHNARLASTFRLGRILATTRRAAFPLRLQLALSYQAERFVLLGDAAHVVHPLAGQGVNLGLRDVAQLRDVLAAARDAGRDFASPPVLQRYARRRRSADTLDAYGFDALARVYAWQAAPWVAARGLGIRLVDRLQPLKRRLAAHAAGL